MRTEETTFLVNDAGISSTTRQAYRDRNLVGLPTSTRLKNASGTIVAQSEVKYDEAAYPPLSYGAITGWSDPGTTVHGLPTTTRSWLNTTGVWLETHAQYDQSGSLRNTWDARGNQSQVEYSSAYAYAYPTLTRTPVPDATGQYGSATALVSTSAYDFYAGVVTSTVDVNNVTTTFEYNDNLHRLTRTVRASGTGVQNQTLIGYDDYNRIVTTTSDLNGFNDNLLKSQTVYDGLGRTKETRAYEGGTNYIATQQQYDSMGRVFKASNPFRPWQSESAVWTTSGFEALGRVTTVTTPDNAVVTTSYSGNTVTVTDQAGKKRKSVSDGLGRLKQVYEDPTALNYLTSYSYDALDNLTNVSQGVQTRTFVYDSLKRLTSAINPESGTVTYSYDENGNLRFKTDARGVVTENRYDALNRVTTILYRVNGQPDPNTGDVEYLYDNATNGKGRLWLTYKWGTKWFQTAVGAYDARGRVTQFYNLVGNDQGGWYPSYDINRTYDLAGHVLTETYPSGRVIETKYDLAGRVAGVRDQQSGIYYEGAIGTDATNRIQYAPHGAVKVMKLGNGLWEHTNFNNRLQPIQIGLGTSSTDSSTLGLAYNYGTTNNNGNVQSVSYAGGGLSYTQTFGYDQLNRLTTSQEGASWSQTNSYDRYGNRSIVGGALTFSANNNRITNGGYVYDLAGNLTNDSTQSFAFDAENKIKSVNGENDVYSYDGDGNRVRKNFTYGEKVRMIYYGGQLVAEYDLSNGSLKKEYVYGAKGLIATIEPANGTRYTTADHLGTPRVVTNSSAGVVSRHDYMPFGEEIGAGIGGRNTGMGFSVVDGLRQKFTSKERDNETGLDYFGARYYASTHGRFTGADPLLSSGSVYDPQSWNRYTYTSNNPLKYTDPFGLYIYDPNATKDQRKKFEEGLKKAQEALKKLDPKSGEYKDLDRAIKAFGAVGVDNGVTVAFGTNNTGSPAATAIGIRDNNADGMKDVTAANPTGQNTVVTFDTSQHSSAADYAGSIGHEGSHVADGADVVGALPVNLTDPAAAAVLAGPLNLTKYATETRAYGVSAAIARGLGYDSLKIGPKGGNQYEVWNSGWRQADRAARQAAGIDRVLAEPKSKKGLYEVMPANQGKRLIE